MGYQMVKKSWC